MAYQSCNKCLKANWLLNDLKYELRIAAFSKNKELVTFANKLLISMGEYENGSNNDIKAGR